MLKPHVFVEDAWYRICELINIDLEQSVLDSEYYINFPEREENKKLFVIYFAREKLYA